MERGDERQDGCSGEGSLVALHRELFGSNSFARLQADGGVTLFLEHPLDIELQSSGATMDRFRLTEIDFRRIRGGTLRRAARIADASTRVAAVLGDVVALDRRILRHVMRGLEVADKQRAIAAFAYMLLVAAGNRPADDPRPFAEAIISSWSESHTGLGDF